MPYTEPTDAHAIQDHRGPHKNSKGELVAGYLENGKGREYPRLMYPLKGGLPKKVSDPKEQAQAEKAGYTTEAHPDSISPDGFYHPPKEEAKPEAPKEEAKPEAPAPAAEQRKAPQKG